MADTKTPPKEDKPKGLIGKLKEAAEDKEEQMVILSTCLLYTSPSPRD